MSRYNPEHLVEPIYEAVAKWREKCLEGNGSIFSDEQLWTTEILDRIYKNFVENPDESGGTFFDKLNKQIGSDPEACKLFAEILWVMHLPSSNIRPSTKRTNINLVWDWSDKANALDGHDMLSDEILVGIGSTGVGFNNYRWEEASFFLTALRKMKDDGCQQILNDDEPNKFVTWIDNVQKNSNRQMRYILPHLIYPDSFERVFNIKDRWQILAHYTGELRKNVEQYDLVEIDESLLKVRKELEQKHTRKIDFYEEGLKNEWQESVQKKAKKVSTDEETTADDSSDAKAENWIFYGPPGTGKTHALKERYLSNSEAGYCEFVTFHQSYSYEDFIQGIRPVVTKDGKVTYKVVPGIFKKLCEKARIEPTGKFVIVIDEINRGNISKIFGELITLIELDKRIQTDRFGQTIPGDGLELKLPYCDPDKEPELFGVPDNISIIGTMNTADQSIASLDSALRRRFKFEKMMPKPSLLKGKVVSDDSGEQIKLDEVLSKMNKRIKNILNKYQTIGHSYFWNVKDFGDLKEVFVSQILPLLEEYFYDYGDEKIKEVLSDLPESIKQIYEEQNDSSDV